MVTPFGRHKAIGFIPFLYFWLQIPKINPSQIWSAYVEITITSASAHRSIPPSFADRAPGHVEPIDNWRCDPAVTFSQPQRKTKKQCRVSLFFMTYTTILDVVNGFIPEFYYSYNIYDDKSTCLDIVHRNKPFHISKYTRLSSDIFYRYEN